MITRYFITHGKSEREQRLEEHDQKAAKLTGNEVKRSGAIPKECYHHVKLITCVEHLVAQD